MNRQGEKGHCSPCRISWVFQNIIINRTFQIQQCLWINHFLAVPLKPSNCLQTIWWTCTSTETNKPHSEISLFYPVLLLCDAPGKGTGIHLAQSHVFQRRIAFALWVVVTTMFSWISLLTIETFSSRQDRTQGINHYLHQLVWLVKWTKDFSLYSWVVHKVDAIRTSVMFSYT